MKRVLTIALAALALATLAGSATAENGHTYNGSYCKAITGSEEADLFHHYYGTFNNAASGGRFIACPVLVDEVDNVTGTTRVWLHWTAHPNTPNDRLACSLFSVNADGLVRQSQSANKTGTGWLLVPNLTSDDYWGSYFLYCFLPRYGIVNTIWVGEQN